MVRTILVPLDGSCFAEHALPLALGIARKAGAAVCLVQVHGPVPALAGMEEAIIDPGWDAAKRASERVYLDGVVERLRKMGDVPVTSALRDGPVAGAIDREAQAAAAPLVVMTTHGRGAVSRFWLGSVADQLVRLAAVPLLLVRPHDGPADFQRPLPLQHVLIPLDGSPLAEQILEPALALGRLMSADFTLLQVIDPFLPAGRDSEGFTVCGLDEAALARMRASAEAYLERIADRCRGNATTVRTRVVVGTRPAEAILEQASATPTDLVALATHGRGGWQRFVLGSVADKVLRGASTPVLIYHPPVTLRSGDQHEECNETRSPTALGSPRETAADLMTPHLLSVREGATVAEAIRFLTDRAVSAAPVIDEAGRPVGVVSQTDIVIHDRERNDRPDYFKNPDLTATSAGAARAGIPVANGGQTKVRDIMTPTVMSVRCEDSAEAAVGYLLSLRVHRLFVTAADGVLVGVISALDVLQHLQRSDEPS